MTKFGCIWVTKTLVLNGGKKNLDIFCDAGTDGFRGFGVPGFGSFQIANFPLICWEVSGFFGDFYIFSARDLGCFAQAFWDFGEFCDRGWLEKVIKMIKDD